MWECKSLHAKLSVYKRVEMLLPNEKISLKGVMEILGSVYKSLSHRRDFVSKKETVLNFEIVYRKLAPWWRLFNVVELFQGSPSSRHFGIEKRYQRVFERFYWPCMRKEERNWIKTCGVCIKRKGAKQKHRLSLTKWKPSHPLW